MAEDVHQEGVGAVGAVQLHPFPVGSSADAAMCGVGLCEATGPFGVGADGGVAGGVKVAVCGLFAAAEDDAGLGAGGLFVQKMVRRGEVLSASVEVAAEERGRPYFLSALSLVCHKTVAGFLYSFVRAKIQLKESLGEMPCRVRLIGRIRKR